MTESSVVWLQLGQTIGLDDVFISQTTPTQSLYYPPYLSTNIRNHGNVTHTVMPQNIWRNERNKIRLSLIPNRLKGSLKDFITHVCVSKKPIWHLSSHIHALAIWQQLKQNFQLSFISTNTHLAPSFLPQLSNHQLHFVPNSCRDKLCSSCYTLRPAPTFKTGKLKKCVKDSTHLGRHLSLSEWDLCSV